MTDGLYSSFERATPCSAGYRLQHLEVFNWGTSDGQAWRLTPTGETALRTGDIGSGKSTLVDALITLLMPAHRIAYNKAAGPMHGSEDCEPLSKATTSPNGTRRLTLK